MFGEIRLPFGKRLNYGKIHHFQWENPLSLWPCANLFITVSWVMTVGEPWFGTEVDYFSL